MLKHTLPCSLTDWKNSYYYLWGGKHHITQLLLNFPTADHIVFYFLLIIYTHRKCSQYWGTYHCYRTWHTDNILYSCPTAVWDISKDTVWSVKEGRGWDSQTGQWECVHCCLSLTWGESLLHANVILPWEEKATKLQPFKSLSVSASVSLSLSVCITHSLPPSL